MNNDIEYDNRQIIPRWLPFTQNNKFFIEQPFFRESPNEEELNNFSMLKNEWLKNKSVTFSRELVASSKTLGITNESCVIEAESYLKKNSKKDKRLFPFNEWDSLSTKNCKEDSKDILRSIHDIRVQLQKEAYDPILWIDLALFHSLAGNLNKAEKCIQIALNMDSNNYFIVRSASRYYVHRENPERALSILNRSPLSNMHPLIVSSEIGIAEAFDLKSKKIKKGFELHFSGDFSPTMLTELSATLATLEFNNGSGKKGKKLLQKALVKPNENSLAQIEFINNRFDGKFETTQYKLPCQYEADAWNAYRNTDYREILKQSKAWFHYQPLSSRPVILYSYINSLVFENYEESIDLIDKALVVSPADPILLNNKAVALAKDGQVDKAIEVISNVSIEPDDENYSVITATRGLIAFRQGKLEEGNKLYLQSITYLKRKNNLPRIARGLYYWGTELIKLGETTIGTKMINESYETSKKVNQKELVYVIDKKRLTIACN